MGIFTKRVSVAVEALPVFVTAMCGRYTAQNPVLIGKMCFEEFDVHGPSMPARYNIAPSQLAFTVTLDQEGKPTGTTMKWGFVPFWEKSDKPRIAPINAKAEEVAAKPMFRQSIQKRRCLLPADGFYEWKQLSETAKQPFLIRLIDGRPFYFAGIFERGAEGKPDTFALLTTSPNELMARIHTRMPAILTGEAATEWLTQAPLTADALTRLTTPYAAAEMQASPVSRLVNNPRNDGPELLAPEPEDDPGLPGLEPPHP